VIQPHEFGIDPRRDYWHAAGSPSGILLHQLGISDIFKFFFNKYIYNIDLKQTF
jgi:hypothetical protein